MTGQDLDFEEARWDYLTAMKDGLLPLSPIGHLTRMSAVRIVLGEVEFRCEPDASFVRRWTSEVPLRNGRSFRLTLPLSWVGDLVGRSLSPLGRRHGSP